LSEQGGIVGIHDEIGAVNKEHWERMVKEGCGFTRPWLDLDRTQLRQYVRGQLDPVPAAMIEMYPVSVLANVEGKEVLCLASGGGQQSAVFALLGAHVTIVDQAEGQLDGDRTAAAHYGYEVTTICADMRDLSAIPDESFALVYQAPSMAYIPDVRPVYAEVFRVLRPGGTYRVCFSNPATEFVDWNSWDGEGYRITKPYSEKMERDAGGSIQFRHTMTDIFDGLVAAGFSIQQVEDSPQYYLPQNAGAQPGTWDHWLAYVGEFAIVAKKG
jgi:SAM-dependent methyltransferase